tara:strand:- start:111 stop:383 length:273 start_codon:yes stop_codon:yes gene_type:complete
MAYLLICTDNENSLDNRLKKRPDHIEYLKKFNEKLLLAGPIMNDVNEPMGSVIILDFESIKDVNNFIKNDPYNEIKLFSDIKIKKFNRVL